MLDGILVAVGVLFLVALGYFLGRYLRAYFRLKGKMLVTCPETNEPVAVEPDTGYAALTEVLGERNLRLRDCTRWPEHADCGQACLTQIEHAPEHCLVRNLLADWYRGKPCVYCGKPFGEIRWHDHKPALRRPDGVTVEWHEIAVEALPEVLNTHQPVCWNCHIAETFRRTHPELVTDRPARPRHLV